jgi:hypothetical protein
MHCYSCDILLSNPVEDKPTGRYYCDACMEPTNEIILSLIKKENQRYSYEDILDIVESLDIFPEDSEIISLDDMTEDEESDDSY